MSDGKIDAMLALRRGGSPLVGRDRIHLLEAVATHGSISKAAKAVGLSYKAAWDALNAINNLLPRPAIVSQAGGSRGGGATVTEDGQALIAAFRLLEDRLGRVAAILDADGTDAADPFSLLRSLAMKTSARNQFRCTIREIKQGAVNAEVVMELSSSVPLVAVITEESVAELGLQVGSEVIALVKSSFVLLATAGEGARISARNQIRGTISRREDGAVNSEFTLDIGGGKSITAIITCDGARDLGLNTGDEAVALIKASHVILAVD